GGRCQWVEPTEDSDRIFSRLLGHAVGPETSTCFRERFSKQASEWADEPLGQARGCLQYGRFEAALTAYQEALVRQPSNWILMNEVALFLAFTLRNPAAGVEMAKVALA